MSKSIELNITNNEFYCMLINKRKRKRNSVEQPLSCWSRIWLFRGIFRAQYKCYLLGNIFQLTFLSLFLSAYLAIPTPQPKINMLHKRREYAKGLHLVGMPGTCFSTLPTGHTWVSKGMNRWVFCLSSKHFLWKIFKYIQKREK